MAGFAADPEILTFLGCLPLGRLAAFPGSPLHPRAVQEMITAARGMTGPVSSLG